MRILLFSFLRTSFFNALLADSHIYKIMPRSEAGFINNGFINNLTAIIVKLRQVASKQVDFCLALNQSLKKYDFEKPVNIIKAIPKNQVEIIRSI